jgi:Flp pilus assembly protein TadB
VLDDVEQRRLSEIDAYLSAADPVLARTLSQHRVRRAPRWVAVLIAALALAVVVPLGWLLAGLPAAIAAGLLVVAVVCGCGLRSRHNRRQPSAES